MKSHYILTCKSCTNTITDQAVLAMLITNPRIKLFSSKRKDSAVKIKKQVFITRTCKCFVMEMCCLNCKSPVGYHVTQPCLFCLRSSNGHVFMYNFESVGFRMRRGMVEEREEIRIR